MIQQLATKYPKAIAYSFLVIFYMSSISQVFGKANRDNYLRINDLGFSPKNRPSSAGIPKKAYLPTTSEVLTDKVIRDHDNGVKKIYIGGPSQPEMSSFKSIGTDNMVNLFSGDFNYNIPLLDVGGYPINLFYDGGVTMEQDASWVGLGWNINPGNINRNMRGVPDDFNGDDSLIQKQNMKPNITWGARLGADFEFVGIKDVVGFTAGVDLGVSVNNYLGPAIDLGVKGGANFTLANKTVVSEKDASSKDTSKVPLSKLSLGVSANIGSRSGFSLTPNVSLSANLFSKNRSTTVGLGLSTSYNSRYGIKELQISEQMSFNRTKSKEDAEKYNNKMKQSSIGENIATSSISFTKPSYIPAIRMPITNEAFSGHFQVGGGLYGALASVEAEVYKQTASISNDQVVQKKPLVGYLYYEKAMENPNAVMDFTRFNDKEVGANTPVISAPQYTYDVFSIQGQGTGGSIRAYRNELGFVRDNFTASKDKSSNIGGDIGIPGHYGANINIIKTPTTIGEWGSGNKLHTTIPFKSADGLNENIYFRNPGESSVLSEEQLTKVGGVDLVRYKLSGSNYNPTIEPILDRFNNASAFIGSINVASINDVNRKKRTQVVNFLTAAEATKIGLDKYIKSYNRYSILSSSNTLSFESIDRVSGDRKKHHISEIDVTEADGKRYIYGIPVYNTFQKDLTFSVQNPETGIDKVTYANNETIEQNDPNNPNPNLVGGIGSKDGYIQTTETPAYAHSFLLSGLLSPDYVDITGDGITEDDLGTAIKFNYTLTKLGNDWATYKWRTPFTANTANFNAGNRSETKDDKGIVSYGERESWYAHSIESKTMIAIFRLGNRKDGKSVIDINGGINLSDTSLKRLERIDLYSKADLKKNGLSIAKPIKSVHFVYSYILCKHTPDNQNSISDSSGKLTLDGVYFTFNGQNRSNKNKYVFSYLNGTLGNPDYQANESDRWGNYKPARTNPDGLKNSDYPYTIQDKTRKDSIDTYAGAWSLKKILLPSGGQIEVSYESDDYAYVQNKRAATMMSVAGFGNTPTSITSKLYALQDFTVLDNDYIFVNVPEACTYKKDVYLKYLQGISQLSVKLAVVMPKGTEYLNSYANISVSLNDSSKYGIYDASRIWIRVEKVDGLSPFSLTALEYLREQLPGQAFKGYDVSESAGLQQVGDMLMGMLDALKSAFTNPIDALRSEGKAQNVITSKCFVRLNLPDGIKYGGGLRVKTIRLKDNWNVMTRQYGSSYGQDYNYTTTEIFNGIERTISSGVASYEPSIGGDENPFQSILQIANKLTLGPTSYGSVEMPVLDAFFPAPSVGYSKVTVRSLKGLMSTAVQKSRSGVGKQVSEFYTAKDYPVIYSYTSLDPLSDKQSHNSSTTAFFYKYAFDSRAISQGFMVATNDMHGKLKSQSSYAENDSTTRINYTENFYRNTGTKGLDDKFDFVHASLGGEIKEGNMGVDVELMTDTREFTVKSNSLEIQAQVDLFPVILPIWLPFIWPVVGNSESNYRAVTTTKVVNYHSVLDSVVVIDKGSMVTTKNTVFDAETGEVIVNRTNNEFNQLVYTVSYPAYWAYSGLGLAYKNINAVFSGINFSDGKIVNSNIDQSEVFESGDELYILSPGTASTDCKPSGDVTKLWVYDKNKKITPLTVTSKDLVFMDEKGQLFSRNNVSFRIIRSGKRNLLDAKVGGTTCMINPIAITGTTRKLSITSANKVINTSASEYKEKWQTDNDVIQKLSMVSVNIPTGNNLIINGNFNNDYLGFTTGYTYSPAQTNGGNEGAFTTTTNASSWNTNGFCNCGDHTSGTGKMMVVNGTSVSNVTVWSQQVQVASNTDYEFLFWGRLVATPSPASLRILVNGIEIGNTYQLPNFWKEYKYVWNSGNATTALVSIINLNTESYGNDFALDDLSFTSSQTCYSQEVVDCNGYLEKSINPYQKGLVGNFKPYRSLVFYGSRKESNPLSGTTISQNGFLANYKFYWDFNSEKNLVPDNASSQWVWNSQLVKANSKGLELETKNALNIYTAAQYGFNKTVPVAITNNARFNETFYEGFEDNFYNESVSGNSSNACLKRHIDFDITGYNKFVNTDTMSFNAHTGKYVLGVKNSISTPLSISSVIDDFNIRMLKDTIKVLNDFGTDVQTNSTFPVQLANYMDINTGGSPMNVIVQPRLYTFLYNNGTNVSFEYDLNATTYFEILQDGIYGIESYFYRNINLNVNNYISMGFSLWKEDGSPVMLNPIYPSSSENDQFFEACLTKGRYKIQAPIFASGESTNTENQGNWNVPDLTEDYYSINVWKKNGNSAPTGYKSLSTLNGCIYTKPIAATDSMLNPIFSLPTNKKMLFSAWVHEEGNNKKSYDDNKVIIHIGSADSIFKPTGPIIDGWQRYEGYFTVSPDQQVSLEMINTSSLPIYFDDIRIHPFNANMKSYVYDPINLRLVAELDANNYASFYEYDEEGTLIRTKTETREGVKTIKETRSAKQKTITTFY